MLKTSLYCIAASAIILFHSCKTLQIEKPAESYLPSNLTPVLSEFPLQIEIDISKLESGVNKKMTGLLYEGSNLNNQDLSVKVWKSQDFAFRVNKNIIEYRVPLKIWTRFAWNVEKFGFSVGDRFEASGIIALTYKTAINIDRNWKLVSKTTSSGFEWIETPKLNVIGVNIPVTPVANIALSKFDKLITEQIDQTLAQMVDLKKYISMAWNIAQKPIQLSQDYNTWVRITPKDIYVSPFTSSENKLNLALSIYAHIESFMGIKPDEKKLVSLPEFKYIQHPPQQFNLNIAADATFEKISEMAKSQLINKTFSEGKKSITITDLSIFGSEGKAVFVADVTGSLKGKIYFTGNMVYNAEKTAVEIKNPQFDVKTRNALVKSAEWLLHGFILNKIAPYLTYNVKADLELMKKEANLMLNNYSVYDGVTLKGKLNSITVNSIDLVPGAVRISANVKGNIALQIAELNL
ncbi:MAG: DUF4403 family protein [Paludibacter sp.]|nr:DUF4403 family protein [Paludibacter sp.]